MSTFDAEIDAAPDAVIIVHQLRWRRLTAFVFFVLFLAVYWCAFVVALAGGEYNLSLNLTFFPFVPVEVLKIRYVWNPVLVISPSQVRLYSQALPLKSIASCHWNRYSPDKLMIAIDMGHSHGVETIPIPEAQHKHVEAALRQFGKWERSIATERTPQSAHW